MVLRKNLILRRPQSGRLEGRTRFIRIETKALSEIFNRLLRCAAPGRMRRGMRAEMMR